MNLTCVVILEMNCVLAVQSMTDKPLFVKLVKNFVSILKILEEFWTYRLVGGCENDNFKVPTHFIQKLSCMGSNVENNLWQQILHLNLCGHSSHFLLEIIS